MISMMIDTAQEMDMAQEMNIEQKMNMAKERETVHKVKQARVADTDKRNTAANIAEQRKGKGSSRQVHGRVRMHKGYGSIRYLGEGRRNAYAVHPPARKVQENGECHYVRQKAICYVPDWFTGFAVLTAWNAGAYVPGMEEQLGRETEGLSEMFADEQTEAKVPENQAAWEAYCRHIQRYMLDTLTRHPKNGRDGQCDEDLSLSENLQPSEEKRATVKEVYERYYESKFGDSAPRKLSKSTADNTRAVSKKLHPIYDRAMDDLTIDELQELVNGIQLGKSMVNKTVILIRELYRYAMSRNLCTKNPSLYIVTPDTRDYMHHQDFTDDELAVLWMHQKDPIVQMVLIMCYSGFRIGAYDTIETNLDKGYFKGGVKTDAGKNRIVPIHSAIMPMIEALRIRHEPYLCGVSQGWFCRIMTRKMQTLGIDKEGRHHTPHSCRHTFSRLCESYDVHEADRKRMLGHSFGNDITNGTYGHRSLEELRAEIEKIRVPDTRVL